MKQYMLSVHMVEGEATPSPEEMQQAYKDVDVFNADIPQTFDAAPDVNPEKFGGRATNVRFSK